MKHRLKLLAAAIAGCVCAGPASAGLEGDLLSRWYSLLGAANGPALSGLMASNARVELSDLGVTQTKKEFIASMAEFAAAIHGGSIRYKLERESANAAVALVCYQFPANDMLSRESFTFARGLVERSVQYKVADDCNQFPSQ
jgi:hypothetical protein